MKKIFIAGIGLFFASTICAQLQKGNEGYVIEGKLVGSYQGKVYLANENGIGGDFTLLDSCEVKNGKYMFKGGKVEVSSMHFIKSNTGKVTPFFLENGHIRIEGKAKDFYNAKVGGTLNNEILNYYNLQLRYVQDSMMAVTSITWMREGKQDEATEKAKYKQRYRHMLERRLAIEKDLVLRYPEQPFAPLMLMFDLAYNIPLDELKQLRNQLSPELAEHPYVHAVDEFIRSQDFKVGSEAYAFILPDLNGRKVNLKDYRGKYVLLDFWASWCGPCRREIPAVVTLYKNFRGKNFEIIGISLDKNSSDWKKAVQEMKMKWPQVSDLQGWNSEVARKYNIHAIPATVLLNPEGKVEALNLRGEKLEDKIREVLKGKKSID